VGILVEMVDPGRVEAAGPPFNAMNLIAFAQQEFS
jgi:hypothetical protein